MSILSTVLVTLVALEFFYIFYLETIITSSTKTSKVFNISEENLKQKSLNTLMKNQGVYNGLIGIILLYAIYFSDNAKELVVVTLIYIVAVASYGAITADKKIILTQGGLAILTLISLLF